MLSAWQTPLVAMHAPQQPPQQQDGPQGPRQGRQFNPFIVPRGRGFQGQVSSMAWRGAGYRQTGVLTSGLLQGVPLELRGVPVQAAMTVEVEGRDGPLEVESRSLTPQQLQQLEQLHQLQQLQQDGPGPQILPVEVIEARAFQHPQEVSHHSAAMLESTLKEMTNVLPDQPQQGQGPPAPMPADTLRPPYQRTPIHAVPPQEEEPRPHCKSSHRLVLIP